MAECPTCGDEFDTEHGMKIHHASQHDERIGVQEIDCQVCGETVEKYDCWVEQRDNVFCSQGCKSQWQSENRSGKNHPQYERVERECKQCGSGFEEIPSKIENGRGKFCSRDCYGRWLSVNNTGESHHQSTGEIIECTNCDGEMYRSPSRIGEINFCSMACQGEWRRENTPTGSDHPNHTGGETKYGPGWNERKRRKVRQRDGYECQDCGMSNEQHKEKYGARIDVHHIKKAKNFDDPGRRNDMQNLVSLCRSCHLGKWEKMSPLKPMVGDD